MFQLLVVDVVLELFIKPYVMTSQKTKKLPGWENTMNRLFFQLSLQGQKQQCHPQEVQEITSTQLPFLQDSNFLLCEVPYFTQDDLKASLHA